MKPVKTLLFSLGVFAVLAVGMLLTPANGVAVAGFTFHMPTFAEMFVPQKNDYVNVDEIIHQQFDIDSLVEISIDTVLHDTITELIQKASYDSLVQSIHKIELSDSGRQNLWHFFDKLKKKTPTRIMHYGDSQIEGDRITNFIRNKFQVKFGGTGPGLRPAVQPYDYVFSAIQTNTDNWKRYPIYGAVDSTVSHKRYGVMGAFSRFAPPVNDTLPLPDSVFYRAGLTISKSNISYLRTRQYKHLRLFYGNAKHAVFFKLFVSDSLYVSDSLKANVDYAVFKCRLPDSTSFISMEFEGYDSPDIYGIELADTAGVIVDNIALRGSSGTIFTKADYSHSLKMYNDLNPGLFLLQFGGNVVPYIKDQKAINNYGRWFGRQIKRIKNLCPDAAIIVIGPSDMSTKEKDKFVTYELLPAVVDKLKSVAVSNDCGYWDMYEAMGGFNSMPGWVNAEPELARPDYVHFSPKGARLIANMFYNALILEYNSYQKNK